MRVGMMSALNLNDPIIAGKSPEISRIKKALKVLANETGNVLFIGEMGSGKNQLAEKLHQLSKRRGHPFVSIECGALGDTIDIDDVFPNSFNTENFENFQFFSAGNGTIFL